MISKNLPHGNLSIHINKYGIQEFTTWKFVNTYYKYGITEFTTWKFVNTY